MPFPINAFYSNKVSAKPLDFNADDSDDECLQNSDNEDELENVARVESDHETDNVQEAGNFFLTLYSFVHCHYCDEHI